MSLTVTQARDDMLGMVKTAIDASSYDDMTILWEDVTDDHPKVLLANPQPYMRVEVQHLYGSQTSLGSPRARFTRRGTVRCRIYTPRGSGMSVADEIVQIVLDTFEGQSSPGGVWFRNTSPRELGADGVFNRVDVVSEFTYNEHK